MSKSKQSITIYKSAAFFKVMIALFFALIVYSQRNAVVEYLGFISNKIKSTETRNVTIEKILDKHIEKSFGIDISEYQNKINWEKLDELDGGYPIEFVFIRATAGSDKKDSKFIEYWAKAKKRKFIRGAYHYYRPNENSIEQANNFIKIVKLQKGDFPPVLDIEKLPKQQSIERLKVGLQKWLDKVESHYGVKPIIYSSESYYEDFLKNDFEEYPFWIANYTAFYKNIDSNWSFWQISENGIVPEITGNVDVNIYNGTSEKLKEMVID